MACKLYVGNLPHGTTDSGLNDFVTHAGFHVGSAVVVRDNMTHDGSGAGIRLC